jgi:hypothetical protein
VALLGAPPSNRPQGGRVNVEFGRLLVFRALWSLGIDRATCSVGSTFAEAAVTVDAHQAWKRFIPRVAAAASLVDRINVQIRRCQVIE